MRGRYPRHYWPENPLEAEPTKQSEAAAAAALTGGWCFNVARRKDDCSSTWIWTANEYKIALLARSVDRSHPETKAMRYARLWVLVACLSAASGAAWAHHSYAMFDTSGKKTVNGTVAKLEWMNPHAFLWVYVPSTGQGWDV